MARDVLHVRVISTRFKAISHNVEGRLSGVVRGACFQIEGRTKTNIVGHGLVDTGNLLNSWFVDFDGPLVGYVGTAVHYAPYHEYGTWALPARPFLVPAVNDTEPWFVGACAAAMRVA
jgi:phage gpG-like protein